MIIGFSQKQSNTELIYSPGSTTIAFTDSENLELKRYSTLNFAGGTEIYMNSIFTHPHRIRIFDSSLSQFTILKLIIS